MYMQKTMDALNILDAVFQCNIIEENIAALLSSAILSYMFIKIRRNSDSQLILPSMKHQLGMYHGRSVRW